jgi:hypothetical protein
MASYIGPLLSMELQSPALKGVDESVLMEEQPSILMDPRPNGA